MKPSMPPSRGDIARRIEDFVRERFAVRSPDPVFSRQVNLWEEGYLDSTGVVEVIAFLEASFAVVIPEEVLFSPEFTRIDGMAGWILELKRRAMRDGAGTDGGHG